VNELILRITLSVLTFMAVFIFIRYGWHSLRSIIARQEQSYERVLNQQLMFNVQPRLIIWLAIACVLFCGSVTYLISRHYGWFIAGAFFGLMVPQLVIRHLEQRRATRLEDQIVDGITALSSSVRAGLNLVQAIELLVKNSVGPIRQEFAQLHREYRMGLDLNQAMRNAANRIGSSSYRLLFTAIDLHRTRGGDTGESLDRIAESIREIHRLEGRLSTLTAQGRAQARMIAVMPIVLIGIYALIDPHGVTLLITDPIGRVLLLAAGSLILVGFLWIRKIMTIDI